MCLHDQPARRSFLFLMICLGLGTPLSAAHTRAAQPNVVLIFVDDMGYGDLGCYGNPDIKTPNIDRLAAEGQRWTSFYASGSTCVPSRTGLMSGRHPALLNGQNLRKTPQRLMPTMFKESGYTTAILGKWHLAGYPKDFSRDAMHPLECGFDYHFGTPGSNDVPAPAGKRQTRDVFDTCDKVTFQVPLIRGREIVEFPVNQELLTKRYTEEAVAWIEKSKDQPFFLYLAHNMPHAPVFASPEFQNRSQGGRYGDVVEEIDWSVGQVRQAVEEAGIAENTLIVFTSDNGPWTMFGPHAGTAGPLRGEKGTSWEGGFRVPGIFYWPGTIQPKQVDGLAANLDLLATFAAIIGATWDASDLPGYMSLDLSGTLLKGGDTPRTQWLYTGGAEAFRSGQYKIHFSTKSRSSDPNTRTREPAVVHSPPLLFDLHQDVAEQHDLAASMPEVVARLVDEHAAFKKQSDSQ